jgi:hypothetical protein
MRLPKVFARDKGGGTHAALGSDAIPTTLGPSETRYDAMVEARMAPATAYGVAMKLAVATSYTGAAAPPGDVQGDVYVWEDATARWYRVNDAPVTLSAGRIAYFALPSIADSAPRSADLGRAGPGGIEALLLVSDPGAASVGTYTFALGLAF